MALMRLIRFLVGAPKTRPQNVEHTKGLSFLQTSLQECAQMHANYQILSFR